MHYSLSPDEIQRLKDGIISAYAIPFVADIEGYVWEAILSYVKADAEFLDPLVDKGARKKHLYDVVNPQACIGWSAKSHQATRQNWDAGYEFQLVVQRADVFVKAQELGYDHLDLQTSPHIIGKALLQHWQQKIEGDAAAQGVTDRRTSILVKSQDRKQYAYYEDTLTLHDPASLEWRWATPEKKGLQALQSADGRCVYHWYSGQKQFFERFRLPSDALVFTLHPQRLIPSETVQEIRKWLQMRGVDPVLKAPPSDNRP